MKTKKLLTSAIALGTAAALTLGGTFAWQSISQKAVNEASDIVNPGGRLHNDLTYIDAKSTDANIYVENFTDKDTGDDIFARVRLSEYMEIVMNYGTEAERVEVVAGSKEAKASSKYDSDDATHQNEFEYDYATHYFGGDNGTADYFTWTEGKADSEAVYMPTFNKNKDSLAADLNGLYSDRVGGISNRSAAQYSDGRADYEVGDETTAWAIYDADYNTADELGNLSIDELHEIIFGDTDGGTTGGTKADSWDEEQFGKAVKLTQETHTAAAVGTTRGLIALSDWLELTENTDGYWVYDDSTDEDGNPTGDGWVYWSAPIKAGTTTGLLLDSFTLNEVMDDTWYYAINVEGQFITANDIGKADNTGFYADDETVTENAEKLLESIGVQIGDEDSEDEEETLTTLYAWDTLSVPDTSKNQFTLGVKDSDAHPTVTYVYTGPGEALTSGTDYTYDQSTGLLTITIADDDSRLNAYGTTLDIHVGDGDIITLIWNDDSKLTPGDRYGDATISKIGQPVEIVDAEGNHPDVIVVYAYDETDCTTKAISAEGNYTYESGYLTITNEKYAGDSVDVYDKDEYVAAYLYLTAASTSGDNASTGGGQTDTTTHTVTAENIYNSPIGLAQNRLSQIDSFEVDVTIDGQDVQTNEGLTLKAYAEQEGGEPVCEISGDDLEVDDGYVCAWVLSENVPVDDNGDTTYYVEVCYTDGGQTFTSNRTAITFRQAIIKLSQEAGNYTIKAKYNFGYALLELSDGTLTLDEIEVLCDGESVKRQAYESYGDSGYAYLVCDWYGLRITTHPDVPGQVRLTVTTDVTDTFVISYTKDGTTYSANVSVVD